MCIRDRAHIGTNASRLLYYYFFCVNFVLTYFCLEFLHRAEQDYIASHKENTVVFANSDNVLETLRKIEMCIRDRKRNVHGWIR